jgi:hypothetical protein
MFTEAAPGVIVAGSVVKALAPAADAGLPVQVVGLIGVCAFNTPTHIKMTIKNNFMQYREQEVFLKFLMLISIFIIV